MPEIPSDAPRETAHEESEDLEVQSPQQALANEQLAEAQVKAAVVALDPELLVEIITSTPLHFLAGPGKHSAALAALVKTVKRERSPEAFLKRAPASAIAKIGGLAVERPLGLIVEALGEDAEDPSEEKLREALEQVSEFTSIGERRLLLAVAIHDHFTAAPHCATILAEEPYRLDLPERLQSSPSSVMAAPSAVPSVDPELKERRKERRREEQEKRRAQKDRAAEADRQLRARQASARAASAAEADATQTAQKASIASSGIQEHWRAPMLTPPEAGSFNADDPWVGGLIYAFIPYDSRDPENPTETGKVRPAIVVAGNQDKLLVRACYSSSGAIGERFAGVALTKWLQLGLDSPSTIDDVKHEVQRQGISGPTAWIALVDWNNLW